MQNIMLNHYDLVWSLALLLAWVTGEIGQRWLRIPPNFCYVLIGFLVAHNQLGLLPAISQPLSLNAVSIVLGLTLFEFGYRINLHWLRSNPRLLVTSLVEAGAVFTATYVVMQLCGIDRLISLEFATLAMATSPVVILYLVNRYSSSGQVTEHVLHLTALNCILAIFCFKLVFGLVIFQHTGSFVHAAWSGFLLIILSAVLGISGSIILTKVFHKVNYLGNDSTLSLVLVVLSLIGVAKYLHLSSLITALVFGLALRFQRVIIAKNQRSFGALGDVALIVYFVAAPALLDWHDLLPGLGLAILLIIVRVAVKVGVMSLVGSASLSRLKSILTGVALTPLSVFPLLMLDPSEYFGEHLASSITPVTATILILDLIGPLLTYYALRSAQETVDV